MRKYILGIFAFFCSCMMLTNAKVFVSAGQLGDVNTDESINASDASAILVHAANIGAGNNGTLSETAQELADVNQDGSVNATDASYILVYSALTGAGETTNFELLTAQQTDAIYLGVVNYGNINKADALNFQYRFEIDGEEQIFTIDNGQPDAQGKYAFEIQNLLKENYHFVISYTQNHKILEVQETEPFLPSYTPPVKGTAGLHTLKNFLTIAMEPVGTTLYMYGGGWDWQDEGSAWSTRTIGISPDWVRFWQEQDANYTYRDNYGNSANQDPPNSYYPYGEYNEYYYTGLDCSGYVGWALYNTIHDENGLEGYVGKSTQMAKRLADYGWGSWSKTISTNAGSDNRLKPGDIMSMNGHVWISLGTCADGSVVIAHSTPSDSRNGQPGGGVQLGAVGTSETCEAYQLASSYMYEYFPEWCERYRPSLKGTGYLSTSASDAGRFRWNTTDPLTDPENVQNMTPAQVLKLIFQKEQ